MKIIEKICDKIEDELEDAESYVHCALQYKEEFPALADTFYQLSLEEMKHMSLLHDHVVKMIADYRKEKGEPPEGMMALYNYLHGKFIDAAASIKTMQAMYKEG